MKKIISALLCVAILLTFASCGKNSGQKSGKMKIVTSIFPVYDWVNNILGDKAENAEVTLLLKNNVDLHNYQPTAQDIVKISQCDLFIYVGGESDEWVEDVLASSENEDMLTINLVSYLGHKAIEETEEMEANEEEEEEEGEEIEYDEHVWLSLRNAAAFCEEIDGAIELLDQKNADYYKSNLTAYVEKLNALDKKYSAAVDNAANKTLVFGDRFPFIYLFNDYGLEHYAAFSGCSAESEASFETVLALAKKIDELKLDNILTLETGDGKLASTIISNTENKNQKVLVLNSFQSAPAEGETYLAVMEENLNVLTEAIS